MKDNVVAVNMKRKETRELSHRSNFSRVTATTTIRSSPGNSVPNIIDSGDYQRFGGHRRCALEPSFSIVILQQMLVKSLTKRPNQNTILRNSKAESGPLKRWKVIIAGG
jgi:hypothetical protein